MQYSVNMLYFTETLNLIFDCSFLCFFKVTRDSVEIGARERRGTG